MATNKQLNKKVKQLEAKLEVKKHESNYIHIPKPCWKGIGKFFLTVLLGFLSYFNFKLILRIWEDYNLGYVFASESEMINYVPKFADLIVLYPLVGEFLLVSLTIICFVSIFKKLKGYDEGGLIFGLIGDFPLALY